MKSVAVSFLTMQKCAIFHYILIHKVFVLLASVLFALAEDDGKYRPEEKAIRPIEIPVTPIIRAFPTTTKVPVYKYNDPRYEWNPRRQWPDRYDPRIGLENPRWDGRYNNNCELFFSRDK